MGTDHMNSHEYTAEDLAQHAQFQQCIRMSWRAGIRAHVLIRQAGLTEDAEANAAFLHVWNNIRTQIDETSHRSL
jgi:hypothetical protein